MTRTAKPSLAQPPLAGSESGAGWELYRGDCLQGMRQLADLSVDVTITDPPYEAEAHTKGRRTKAAGWRTAAARGEAGGVAQPAPLPFAAVTKLERDGSAIELARLTRRWVLVFCQVEATHLWSAALVAAGLEYIRTMVWTKPNAQPQFTGDRPGHGYESIVVAHRPGRKRWNGGGRLGTFDYCTAAASYETIPHPTTKPQPLMRELISLFSDPDELILDPFAGSGSTGVAARMLGRRFLGFELSPDYHAIACRRLRGEAAKPNDVQQEMWQCTK